MKIQITSSEVIVTTLHPANLKSLELARSYGFSVSKDYRTFVAPIRGSHPRAIYYFAMTISHGNIGKDTKEKLVRGLTEIYDEEVGSFKKWLDIHGYKHLYDHQKHHLFYLLTRKYNLLAHQQGLGKSLTSSTASVIYAFGKTLIICPSNSKWKWSDELVKWGTPLESITIADSNSSINATTSEKFVIINHELVNRRLKQLMSRKFDHIIVDECHKIKNTRSKRYKSLKAIFNKDRPKVTFLSGTPVYNRVDDMFAYLAFIDHPLGKSYKSFIDRYTYYVETSWGTKIVRSKNTKELRMMLANFVLRMRKDDCMDLPSKIEHRFYFDLDDYEAEYNREVHRFLSLDPSKKHEQDIQLSRLNIITSKSKIKGVLELAENIIYGGEKVVIFSWFREPINMLKNHFRDRCVVIDGRVGAKEKHELKKRFDTEEEIVVLVGQTQAAGVAIDIDTAWNCIFCDLPYTQTEIEQATDRMHGIGRGGGNDLNIYFTVCRDSVDEILYKIIESKSKDASRLLDGAYEKTSYSDVTFKMIQELRRKYGGKKVK